MDAERWAKLESLFEQAQALDSAEQIAWLQRECGDDAELLHRLNRMLRAAAEEEISLEPGSQIRGLLDQYEAGLAKPGSEPTDGREGPCVPSETVTSHESDTQATETRADRGAPPSVGRYEIVDHHAKGGQGEVFLAHDHELHREVALKKLRTRYAEDADSRTRFLMEAEITGGLEHPGIIPVYSLGALDDGSPFYAMRFVRGDSLKDAIDRFHKADGPQRAAGERSLALRRLLARFIDVCNAIRYAHSRGILHRDLKPANVMLGKYGETLVVDWGLAKTVGKLDENDAPSEVALSPSSGSGHSPTVRGSVLGTPHYMSPEQADGKLEQIGPASDVYGLGATLYCLLTGRPPFTTDELQRCQKSTGTGRFCSPWSQGVVPPRPRQIKPQVPASLEAICLKAIAFEPEDRYASPGALAEDIEHWLADEPVSAYHESWRERLGRWSRRHKTLIRAGTAAAAAILVAAVVSFVFYTNAAKEREIAAKERELSKRRLQIARDAIDTWLTGPAEDLKYYPDAQKHLMESFRKATDGYRDLVSQETDDVELKTEQSRTIQRIGDVLWLLGDSEASLHEYDRARALLEDVTDEYTAAREARLELAKILSKIGLLHFERRQYASADTYFGAAIDELSSLEGEMRDDPRLHDALGFAFMHWGVLKLDLGNLAEAQSLLRESVDEFDTACDMAPNRSDFVHRRSAARVSLGIALVKLSQLDAAADQFRSAIFDLDRIIDPDDPVPDHFDLRGDASFGLASVRRAQGRYRKEIDAYEVAIDSYEVLCKHIPHFPRFREQLARALTDLAQAHYKLGNTIEAEDKLTYALETLKTLPYSYEYQVSFAVCLDYKGLVLSAMGQYLEAKEQYGLSAEFFEELIGIAPENRDVRALRAICRSHHAQIHQNLGDADEAEASFKKAISELSALIDRDSDTSQNEDVPADYRDALAHVYKHAGTFLWTNGRETDGIEYLNEAQALWQKLASRDEATAEHRHHLARFYVECVSPGHRDPKEAVRLARQARESAPYNPDYACTLGAAYYRGGKWSECIKILKEAEELRRGQSADLPDRHCRDLFYLAMAQSKVGEDEASKSFNEACRWLAEHIPGDADMQRLKDEAAQVLGIAEQGD